MPQFQHVVFHAKFAKSVKKCSKGDPLWKPRSANIRQKCLLESNIKNTFKKISKNDATTEAQHLPNKAFRLKGLHFLRFATSAKKCSKWFQKTPWNDPKIFKNACGGLPKAMPKINTGIDINKMHKNQIWEPKCSKIGSQNGGPWGNFLKSFSVPSSRLPPGGPTTPKIMTKSWKNAISESLFRLELYLPSPGKMKMPTQYAQTGWGGGLGVRRWHAAGVFDNQIEKNPIPKQTPENNAQINKKKARGPSLSIVLHGAYWKIIVQNT